MKYLDDVGLTYLWGKLKNAFASKTHTHTKNQITDFPTIPSTSDFVKTSGSQQTITSSSDTPLKIKSTNTNNESWIGLTTNNGINRYFGTDGNGKPLFYAGSNKELALKSDISTDADTVDGYHIRTGTSGAEGYITFVLNG